MTVRIVRSNDYLEHYASPYYDPVKAHEYYEQNKQLKGRRSTAKLSDTQKEALTYVKKQIGDERKAKLKTRQERYKQDTEARREEKNAEIKRHSEAMNKKIETLRSQLERMTPEQRRNKLDAINARIGKLRDENNSEKARLNDEYATDRAKLSLDNTTDKDKIRADAKAKYDAEYDAIVGDKSQRSLTGKSYRDYSAEEKKQLRAIIKEQLSKK